MKKTAVKRLVLAKETLGRMMSTEIIRAAGHGTDTFMYSYNSCPNDSAMVDCPWNPETRISCIIEC